MLYTLSVRPSPAYLRWFVAVALLSAATLSFSPTAKAQEAPPPLDHFKCYRTGESDSFPRRVLALLEDQFDIGMGIFDPVRVRGVRLFCNPTLKQHGTNAAVTIQNPDNHLTLYRIRQLFAEKHPPKFEVNIDNQFGQQTLIVQNAKFLMVPSKKVKIQGVPTNHGDPVGLDHYKCYSVVEQRFEAGTTLGLRDEFDIEQMRSVVLGKPFLFCNSTRKSHVFSLAQHQVTEIQNPQGHLTCYEIVQEGKKRPRNVEVENQFGGGQVLQIGKPGALCVPSLKLNWALLPPPDDNVPESNED